MKGLTKICPLFFGQHRGIFNRNRNILLLAAYSRSSSNSKSPYKIVQAKIKNAATSKSVMTYENNANWELFPVAKNNRFFLREGLVGPAYISYQSCSGLAVDFKQLIDFDNKDKSRLHISFKKCPVLIRKNLAEIFPDYDINTQVLNTSSPEVINENTTLSLITLSQVSSNVDHEKAAIDFVHASREICQRLRLHGYWSDFLNPFSGKAFFSYHQKSLYKSDERFRGLCMKLEEVKGVGSGESCLLISEDKSAKFNGSIFTNIPSMEMFEELVLEDD